LKILEGVFMPFFEKNRAFSSSIWVDGYWGVISTFITKYLQNINLNEKDCLKRVGVPLPD